jgi:hypothetical protein
MSFQAFEILDFALKVWLCIWPLMVVHLEWTELSWIDDVSQSTLVTQISECQLSHRLSTCVCFPLIPCLVEVSRWDRLNPRVSLQQHKIEALTESWDRSWMWDNQEYLSSPWSKCLNVLRSWKLPCLGRLSVFLFQRLIFAMIWMNEPTCHLDIIARHLSNLTSDLERLILTLGYLLGSIP